MSVAVFVRVAVEHLYPVPGMLAGPRL